MTLKVPSVHLETESFKRQQEIEVTPAKAGAAKGREGKFAGK